MSSYRKKPKSQSKPRQKSNAGNITIADPKLYDTVMEGGSRAEAIRKLVTS